MQKTIYGKIYKMCFGNLKQILQQLSAKWTQHENKPHCLLVPGPHPLIILIIIIVEFLDQQQPRPRALTDWHILHNDRVKMGII